MLRIHLLQQWHSLSDPAMEEALIEVPTMRRFAGIDLISDRIPYETTILAFWHLLEKHELGEQIFESVKAHLNARGMTMRQGTIVDATWIAAPSLTKNREGKRDPEMRQTKKGNQWYWGEKANEPRMMVVLLLYAYCVGLPSCRRIEKACWEDAAFRVLTGNQQPDHSRISDFRRRHLDALAGLFVQVLRLCQKAGLGHVALNGTKVKANASKHKAMSHERMLKTEKQLETEMRALLRKAEIIDAQDDGQYGKGKRGDELPQGQG